METLKTFVVVVDSDVVDGSRVPKPSGIGVIRVSSCLVVLVLSPTMNTVLSELADGSGIRRS